MASTGPTAPSPIPSPVTIPQFFAIGALHPVLSYGVKFSAGVCPRYSGEHWTNSSCVLATWPRLSRKYWSRSLRRLPIMQSGLPSPGSRSICQRTWGPGTASDTSLWKCCTASGLTRPWKGEGERWTGISLRHDSRARSREKTLVAFPIWRWCLSKVWSKLCDCHDSFSRTSYYVGRSVKQVGVAWVFPPHGPFSNTSRWSPTQKAHLHSAPDLPVPSQVPPGGAQQPSGWRTAHARPDVFGVTPHQPPAAAPARGGLDGPDRTPERGSAADSSQDRSWTRAAGTPVSGRVQKVSIPQNTMATVPNQEK